MIHCSHSLIFVVDTKYRTGKFQRCRLLFKKCYSSLFSLCIRFRFCEYIVFGGKSLVTYFRAKCCLILRRLCRYIAGTCGAFSSQRSYTSVANYLSTIIIVIILLHFFLENSENDSKLKEWINCGIYPRIYFLVLGLDLDFDTSGRDVNKVRGVKAKVKAVNAKVNFRVNSTVNSFIQC